MLLDKALAFELGKAISVVGQLQMGRGFVEESVKLRKICKIGSSLKLCSMLKCASDEYS